MVTRASFFFVVLGIFSLVFTSCHKTDSSNPQNPPPPGTAGVPSLTTTSITGITISSANTGGIITNHGGSNITEKGICYAATASPTTSNFIITSAVTSDTFSISIGSLLPNTTYYVRAYAKNSAGTGYGNELSFHTLSGPVNNPDTAATLFVGAAFAQKLYALNASDGSIKWSVTLGGLLYSSPIYSNGRVFIGCSDNKLYAYDTLGVLKWTCNTSAVYKHSPIVANGMVYFPDQSGVNAVNASTGALVWRFPHGADYLVLKNNVIYINAGRCYAIDAITGAQRWEYNTGGNTPPVVLNDRVYATNHLLGDSLDVLSTANGSRIWGVANYGIFWNVLGMSIQNGRLYCVCETDANNSTSGTDGLNILDSATANVLYPTTRFTTTERMGDGVTPIFADGVIFVPTYLGVNALNPVNGQLLYTLPGGGSATVVGDIIYFMKRMYTIYPPGGNPYDAGFVHAYNYKTGTYVWSKAFINIDFLTSSPCAISKTGKIYRGGVTY
jgi:outer membrane protein assembly factor BamB